MDTYTPEQELRQEAIRRRLEGQSRPTISKALRRSLSWVAKWWAEYRHNPKTDFADPSRAPHTVSRCIPLAVARAVVNLRRTLEAARTPETKYGFIGARAIRTELERQHITPLPSLATIQRILMRHALTHPQGAGQDSAYYPGIVAWTHNVLHATDIIIRYVQGGEAIHNFHTFDHYSHAAHLSQHADKTSATTGQHLLETWADLGLPLFQQFDNEDCFKGGHTHPRVIGQVVRLCLFVGLAVVFIPQYEGERNYGVEGFHSLWCRGFWNREHFRNLAHVQREAPTFARWYHTRYAPPALGGKTPGQLRQGFHPLCLTRALRGLIPERLPITAGYIHFFRKVEAQGQVRLLNETWNVGTRWRGQYVLASVNTAKQTLTFWHLSAADVAWRKIKVRQFRLSEPVSPLLPAFRQNHTRCREYCPG